MNEQKPPGMIEWTRVWGRRGYTWNPIVGCKHQCEWDVDGQPIICYAKAQAEGPRLSKFYPEGFAHLYFYEERLDEPAKVAEPSGVFISSMGDLFGAPVTDKQLDMVFQACAAAPQHIFFALTKDPARMLRYVEQSQWRRALPPPNVWFGASMPPDRINGHDLREEHKKAYLSRTSDVMLALRNLGYITFMLFEPLSWDLARFVTPSVLAWAIVGAASAGLKYFPPERAHIDRLLQRLDAWKVPVFFRGNMKCVEGLEMRQEFPPEPQKA